MRRVALLSLLALTVAQPLPALAEAAAGPAAVPQRQLDGTWALLGVLARDYRNADPTHEASGAARVRTMALALEAQLASWQGARSEPALASALAEARELRRTLSATSERLQPWPLPMSVEASIGRVRAQLRSAGLSGAARSRPYAEIDALLADAQTASAAGVGGTTAGAGSTKLEASTYAIEAFALYASGPGRRLQASNTALATEADDAFWRDGIAHAGIHARTIAETTATVLGATAVTYAIAQALVNALGDGGLRLQAITGLLAIAVLLLVTNWFFHRVYWSEWLGRFHRRRRALERIDRPGLLSRPLAGLGLAGVA